MKKSSMLLMLVLSMAMASHHALAQEVTITLNPGWTWISYPEAETMDIATALGGFTPVQGDIINSQTGGSTSYVNGQWRGILQQFTPGVGYMYYSNRTETVSFVFGAEPVNPNPGTVPTGAINGKFTINVDGDQVYFSQGNLQYQASTDTWRFAMSQWDYVGAANSNISPTYSGWIDLFGWGTSGYHNPNDPFNLNYQPWSTSTTAVNSNYNGYGYGPSTNMGSQDLTGSSANYDWGVYNAISNGGNQANLGWRTLSRAEWYFFSTRNTAWGMRYAKAQVNGINGYVLLPDDWSPFVYTLYSADTYNAAFNTNVISINDWMDILEPNGVIFLPMTGSREGTTYNSGNGIIANYWSSTHKNSSNAYSIQIYNGGLIYDASPSRHAGKCVRLVYDVQ